MPADEQLPIEAAESFESLSKLRAAHVDLMRAMRRDGSDDDLVRRVRKFLDRAKATGTRIDSPADRDTAENIIMYWVSYRFTADDREALWPPSRPRRLRPVECARSERSGEPLSRAKRLRRR